jgi:hypothetical protein
MLCGAVVMEMLASLLGWPGCRYLPQLIDLQIEIEQRGALVFDDKHYFIEARR